MTCASRYFEQGVPVLDILSGDPVSRYWEWPVLILGMADLDTGNVSTLCVLGLSILGSVNLLVLDTGKCDYLLVLDTGKCYYLYCLTVLSRV